MFVRASLYKRREGNQLDATECFIALIICWTCFGHLYAHHQELETILVSLPLMVCNVLVAGGRQSGAGQQAMRSGWGKLIEQLPSLHTLCGNNTSIVSRSWWWAYKCPKHVEQIISAINHSVASSRFSSLRLYNDARTNTHQPAISCLFVILQAHSSWPSVCLYACFSAAPTGRIFVKFVIGDIHENPSRNSKFGNTEHFIWSPKYV